MDRGRHVIIELATGSRRCPIEAVRDLIANPGVMVARQGTSFVTNSDELDLRNGKTTKSCGQVNLDRQMW